MRSILTKAIVALGALLLPAAAPANVSIVGPTYIGMRSANPEQETYGYRIIGVSEQLLAFVGPARNIGVVTGDDEKDTVAYRPLLGTKVDGTWLLRLAL